MRYSPEHKATARRRLIEAGGALAKKEGFSNTGMDALTAAAGVTTGAFYSQFRTKSEFLDAIIDHEFERTIQSFAGKSGQALVDALALYLSPLHAAHPEKGCPIPSLGAEIARADESTRAHFEELLVQLHGIFAKSSLDTDAAWALMAQAIGGIVLARAVASPALRDALLNAVLSTGKKFIADRPR